MEEGMEYGGASTFTKTTNLAGICYGNNSKFSQIFLKVVTGQGAHMLKYEYLQRITGFIWRSK